jgi:hypothetical protein
VTEHGPNGARAVFDLTKRFRYTLRRELADVGGTQRVVFVMLNPSTADAFKLDPTVRRCLEFARRWGCGILDVVNLFALRSTYPRDLYSSTDDGVSSVNGWEAAWDAIGADRANDKAIVDTCMRADLVIAAWGNHGHARRLGARGGFVRAILEERGVALYHLGLSKSGAPLHPIARGKSFIPSDRAPVRWNP